MEEGEGREVGRKVKKTRKMWMLRKVKETKFKKGHAGWKGGGVGRT